MSKTATFCAAIAKFDCRSLDVTTATDSSGTAGEISPIGQIGDDIILVGDLTPESGQRIRMAGAGLTQTLVRLRVSS